MSSARNRLIAHRVKPRVVKTVDIDGETYYFREITANQFRELAALFSKHMGPSRELIHGGELIRAISTPLLKYSLSDENGNRIVADGEEDLLDSLEVTLSQKLTDEAMAILNGITSEKAEGKSTEAESPSECSTVSL